LVVTAQNSCTQGQASAEVAVPSATLRVLSLGRSARKPRGRFGTITAEGPNNLSFELSTTPPVR
jgi:hypothetical protein